MNYKHEKVTVSGTGIMQRMHNKKIDKELDDPGVGKHLWVMTSAYLITEPAKAFTPECVELDIENLIVTVGPFCYKCEELFDPAKTLPACTGRAT